LTFSLTYVTIIYGQEKEKEMPICKVCNKDLELKKFSSSYRTNAKGERVEYKDSTCMVCRRKHHLSKPGKKDIHRKGSSKWYLNNPLKVKEQRLRKYGLTLQQYNNLRESQKFSCAICNKHETNVPQGRASITDYALHVDHSHTTNKVRGLLCTNCNTILGKCYDDPKILKNAIKYLETFEEKTL
jgi:hypothetical protein